MGSLFGDATFRYLVLGLGVHNEPSTLFADATLRSPVCREYVFVIEVSLVLWM